MILLGLVSACQRVVAIEIPDPQLEAAIRAALADHTNSATNLDLTSLTCLWACHRQITNLDGLEWATNLTSLYLNENAISDLTALGSLTRLSALELSGNPVRSLEPLAALQNLRCLALGRHPVTDYSALAGLTNLDFLSLREAPMVSLTNLRHLTRLTSLKLWETRTRDVSALASLTNLTCLDLRWNSITNLASSLTSLPRLTNLYVGGNSLSNVAFLKHLKQLTLLNLDDNDIADASPVTNLTNLKYLAMSKNAKAKLSVLGNLPGLLSLELRGNTVSNLSFLAGLSHLSFLDMAYNSISDLRPLTNLTALNGLVLAGNRVADYTPLRGMPNLTNLWLFDNAITNASFLTNLTRLNHLDLDQNRVPDIRSLATLTNLTGLGLSGNPVSSYADLTNFTRLHSLRLERNGLTTNELAGFLPSLTELRFLDLNHNRLSSLAPLTGLSYLEEVYLRRNRLAEIGGLTNLPHVLAVDASLNMLDLSPGSTAILAIRNLESRRTGGGRCVCGLATNATADLPGAGMIITYEPQNQAPRFTSLLWNEQPLICSPVPRWFVPANANSSLTVSVWEDPQPAENEFVVTASSWNSNVVSVVTNPLPGTDYSRTLSVAAGNPSTQEATVALTVTDSVLLSASTNILITVVANTNLLETCPNIDRNLAEGISAASGMAVSNLTLVDLLMLSQLYVDELTNGSPCAWQWLTNVTTLAFNNNLATNVDFLTHLTQLTSFALYNCRCADFSALGGLSNLRTLSVYDGSISDLSFLSNLTQLTSLTINGVTATDFSPLAGLTNLIDLSLYGPSVTNLTFLSNATQLVSLTLHNTRVADLAPLAGLSNLQLLHLSQNRIEDVSSLPNLARLSYVDLRWNLLDFSPGTAATATIQALWDLGVIVSAWPQREPPSIVITTNWVIRAGQESWLYFKVMDNTPGGELSVSHLPVSGPVITDTNVAIGRVGERYYGDFSEWWMKVVPSGPGSVTITLRAANDGGLRTDAPVDVMVVAPLDVTDSFFADTNLVSWLTGGQASWFGLTNIPLAGAVAAQSGSTTHSGESWLQAVATNGPGTLTFWWKVSSETNYDFLRFYLGTNEVARISGEVDWHAQTCPVPPGAHTLRWNYSKDADNTGGLDAGWVAQVSFTPASWLEVAGTSTNGECTLRLWLPPGKVYEVLYSSNLLDWSFLGTVTATNQYTDANGVAGVRFYRLQEVSVWLEAPVRLASGTELVLHGPIGLPIQLQASTNLAAWNVLAWLTNTSGTLRYTDVLSPTFPMRFYRAVVQP